VIGTDLALLLKGAHCVRQRGALQQCDTLAPSIGWEERGGRHDNPTVQLPGSNWQVLAEGRRSWQLDPWYVGSGARVGGAKIGVLTCHEDPAIMKPDTSSQSASLTDAKPFVARRPSATAVGPGSGSVTTDSLQGELPVVPLTCRRAR